MEAAIVFALELFYSLSVTYFVGKRAITYAYAERGYEACGGEYLLVLLCFITSFYGIRNFFNTTGEKIVTIGQRTILRYIDKNFVRGSVRTVALGDDKIMVIDSNGESLTLTTNIYCDIMDADTGVKYAISNLPHDVNKIGTKLPTEWTELDRR